MSEKKIAQIREEFQNRGMNDPGAFISQYETDERNGVKQLVIRARRQVEHREQEYLRLENMKQFERQYASFSMICGIDEAGRGPLAGPVVAGAVILPKDANIMYLNDSKQVSAARRELLYDEICEKALAYAVGMIEPEVIDQINILQATYLAMRQAVEKLALTPDLLLVDAVTIPCLPMKQVGIIKGDARSVSIAAASILAKVTRDRMMCEYAKKYPEYDFDVHKGYGTAKHIAALKKYGSSPIHRQSFIKKFVSDR